MAKGFASDREWEICNEVEGLTIRATQIRLLATEIIEEAENDDAISHAGIIKVLSDTLEGEIKKIAAFIKNPEAKTFDEE